MDEMSRHYSWIAMILSTASVRNAASEHWRVVRECL
jgi:hypothetical protein